MSNTNDFYSKLPQLFEAHRSAEACRREVSEHHVDILTLKGLHMETMAMLGKGTRTGIYTNGECYDALITAWPDYRAYMIDQVNKGFATSYDLGRAYDYYRYAEGLLAKYADIQRIPSAGVGEQKELF